MLSYLSIVLLFIASSAAQAPVILVPNPGVEKSPKVDPISSDTISTSSPDDVYLVLDRAVVWGEHGAQFSVDPQNQTLMPTDGKLVIHVGTTPLKLRVGDANYSFKSLRAEIISDSGDWAIRFLKIFDAAQMSQLASPPGEVQPTVEQQNDSAVAAKVRVGQVYWLEKGGPAIETSAEIIGEVFGIENLSSAPNTSHPSLIPSDFEDLDRLEVRQLGELAGAVDIELEPVEVEAGCVEVCVD